MEQRATSRSDSNEGSFITISVMSSSLSAVVINQLSTLGHYYYATLTLWMRHKGGWSLPAVVNCPVAEWSTVCSKKSDTKIEITITVTNLIRIKYPLSSFNYHLAGANVANFTKSTAQFLSNSCLQNGTQKQKFPIWKSRLSSSYAIPSVTVCAQNGRHLHRHLHVSCADRTFSAAAGLTVCRPCIVNLPQKSVQYWTRPVLVRKFLQQLSGTVTVTLP